jgi:nitrogen fixation protein FixH
MLSFFGVIFVVNGIFVYMATTTWTGISTEKAYEKGLRYNETLEAVQNQSRLGWKSTVAFAKPYDNLVVRFETQNGAPVSGLRITGMAVRPTHEGYDQALTFTEAQPGDYAATVRLPLQGVWRIELVAASQDGKAFRADHKLMVSP